MKTEERISRLKTLLRGVIELYYAEKSKPHGVLGKKGNPYLFKGVNAFKDSGLISEAELAVDGLYHVEGSDTEETTATGTRYKSTWFDENAGIFEQYSLKCKYVDCECIINDTVFGSSCSICNLNPNRTNNVSITLQSSPLQAKEVNEFPEYGTETIDQIAEKKYPVQAKAFIDGYLFGTAAEKFRVELQAKEETYPAEFCLWVAKKCCNQEMSVTPEELFDFMGNEYTLPELFKYWTDNVKGK